MSPSIKHLDKILFTKHLAIMVKSGVSLPEALRAFCSQTQSSAMKAIVDGVLKSVENGMSLASSLRKYPKAFDAFYVSLVDVSEKSSSLDENLAYLADQLQRSYEFKRKVKSAMLYPTFVFGVALVIGVGVSLFVLPKLLDLFSVFEVKLPLATRILIALATTMQDYGIFIFSGIFAFILGLRALIAIKKFRYHWQYLLLNLPIISSISQSINLGALCRNFGVMLKSGLSITAAFSIEIENAENLVYRSYLEEMRDLVLKGESLSACLLKKKYKFIPPLLITMVGVGEKTGKLDESFLYLGDFFEAELDTATKNISIVLEPILLVVIAFIVGFMALAIITPIYDLTGSVER